jgi:hypothetical protein
VVSKREERRRRELERLQKAIERQKAEARSQREAESAPEEPEAEGETQSDRESPPEPSELEVSLDSDRSWERFEAADLAQKEALFEAALESGEMGAGTAFEMLGEIRRLLDTGDPRGWTRYGELVERLRERAPDVYQENEGYYRRNLISDAVAGGRWGDVPQLLAPFADNLATDLDLFSQIIDQLSYYGRIETLIEVMAHAWPKVRDSDDVVPWAIDEFGGRLMKLYLFHYLETTDDPRADDPKLREATAQYGQWEEAWLERVILRLTAPEPSEWDVADFGPAVDADEWRENLTSLLAAFVVDRRRAGVPYSRGDMAWMELRGMLSRQLAVPARPLEAEPKGSAGGRRRRRREMMIPAPLPLVPRYPIVEKALIDLFPFFGAQPYQAAALMELLPSYLHFLARLGLIHPVQMDAVLDELRPLSEHTPRTIRSYGADSRAVEAVEAAWSGEVLTALKEDPALVDARQKAPEPLPQLEPPSAHPGAVLTYTFKVTYLRDPDVWRVIEMRANQTLNHLHHAIQDAVDFDADHLYSFYMSNKAWDETTEYSSPYTEGLSAGGVKIRDLNLRMKQRFLYLFDYGDEHRFEIQLIGVDPQAPKEEDYPRIVESHGEDPLQYGEW